jgi:hypothetical protein
METAVDLSKLGFQAGIAITDEISGKIKHDKRFVDFIA